MKKTILLVFCVFSFLTLEAQDHIFTINGKEVVAKITEVNNENVKFIFVDSLKNGQSDSILLTQIYRIKYQNGVEEFYNESQLDENIFQQKESDEIYFNNGEIISVTVKEISPLHIKYTLSEEMGSAVKVISSTKVSKIKFKNGFEEIFSNSSKLNLSGNPEHNFLLGKQDAKKYFNTKEIFWATYAITVLHPPVGFALGGTISLINADEDNFIVLDYDLLQNEDYKKGYAKQAKKEKLNSAAKGVGAGVLTDTVIFVAFFGILSMFF